ncbi:hypothetical protein QUC32_27720 (plasmid) [Novosphingobium resinovorum]|uniref:DoxX family protein n=1 Tax=Sphingomonadaceae TaxID=41297 RepID=UPI001E348C37|nr:MULTISPECIES: hypothetical protein [Sphingomonadaceae]WJM30160.1 hypothetical protein QUC32_27720 [Novosphingobium resinovorum]
MIDIELKGNFQLNHSHVVIFVHTARMDGKCCRPAFPRNENDHEPAYLRSDFALAISARAKLAAMPVRACLVFAGYKHIPAPDGFAAITPRWVPLPDFVVWATGWCEIAGAAGLLVPKRWSPRAYRGASIALAAYALCVWPANFNHALHDIPVAGVHLSWWYHGPRLAFQPMLIWALLWAGHIIDWPFGRPHC